MGSHINERGEFQSDKYPMCPAGKVPLSTKDTAAQDLLWRYAQRRRVVDAEFSDDLETVLRRDGYVPGTVPAAAPATPFDKHEAVRLASKLEQDAGTAFRATATLAEHVEELRRGVIDFLRAEAVEERARGDAADGSSEELGSATARRLEAQRTLARLAGLEGIGGGRR